MSRAFGAAAEVRQLGAGLCLTFAECWWESVELAADVELNQANSRYDLLGLMLPEY